MTKNELRQKIGIKDIYRNDDYIFVYLDNEQNYQLKMRKYMIFLSMTLFIKLLL